MTLTGAEVADRSDRAQVARGTGAQVGDPPGDPRVPKIDVIHAAHATIRETVKTDDPLRISSPPSKSIFILRTKPSMP